MKPFPTFRSIRGTTLVELIVGMLITSCIVYAVYKAWHYFDVQTNREKYKAELQRDMITVANFIERDIRMAGYGLPGNGIHFIPGTASSDQLALYNNEAGTSTALAQDAQPVDSIVYVNDGSIFTAGASVCLSGTTDTIYRNIAIIGIDPSGDDSLILTERLNTVDPLWASSVAYPALRVRYELCVADTVFTFKRFNNGMGVAIGGKLDSLEVKPKDDDGNIIGGSGKGASVITIVMGGYVGRGNNRVFMAESTEVNIRNSY
jgi:Tfp pilus assembly protein PilE